MPNNTGYKTRLHRVPRRLPDVLDVRMTATLLMVSRDRLHDLFPSGELPGRKVGRKWITTKAAVLRWIDSTSTDVTLVRAISKAVGER
jgi:hypothetical protein